MDPQILKYDFSIISCYIFEGWNEKFEVIRLQHKQYVENC